MNSERCTGEGCEPGVSLCLTDPPDELPVAHSFFRCAAMLSTRACEISIVCVRSARKPDGLLCATDCSPAPTRARHVELLGDQRGFDAKTSARSSSGLAGRHVSNAAMHRDARACSGHSSHRRHRKSERSAAATRRRRPNLPSSRNRQGRRHASGSASAVVPPCGGFDGRRSAFMRSGGSA